ncbi:HPP family protein [Streptomyces sp. NPDC051561]|uniref:HPP family protein n=1 Tax=Streptomyces sp. NPDC051561 TaxID=3365658 RepID=UPI00378F3EC2
MTDTSTLHLSTPEVSGSDPSVTGNSLDERTRWRRYADALAGQAPARAPMSTVAVMTVCGVAVMLLLVALGVLLHQPLLIPPLAASAALVFAAPALPLAQPRSVIGGQLISAALGLGAVAVGGSSLWTAAVAAGLTIGAMAWARTPHSPAAATAVIVVLTNPEPWHFLGLLTLATLVIVAMGALIGRVDRVKHRYPVYWW